MKRILTPIVAIVLMAMASSAFAQNARIVNTITTQKHDPAFSLGRDFWFAPGQNDEDMPGKYIRIYITSPNTTTAYVECEGVTKAVPVPSYGIGTFNASLEWEMKSSGVVENKAIHVYDPTDDISVYLMSHNPYSSDGMYCIPTIGLGTDYVVAAYESLFDGFGSYADEPCDFTISSDQDNTIVEITPSCDFRQSSQYPNGATTVGHPQGKKFEDTLNRGQSIQFLPVEAYDADNFDVTGTIIHSNNPVGVVGASMCPNIPPDYPYCDYVTDMIRPVRTWGETYYSTTPIQPQGLASHNSAMYLMVASKNNQTIHIYDAARGDRVVCTIDSQYHIFWAEETMLNKWYSDAPFMLVQYINSATYPDGDMGSGDPAEAVMSPRESYPKTAYYIAPPSSVSQAPYANYANVIVNNNDIRNVTFDGNSIQSYSRQTFDDTSSIYLVPKIQPGAHVIKSDSGVGVYGYGYGYDETFSWGGSYSAATVNSPDTMPPVALISSNCFDASVHLADTGTLASKISEIILDSNVNMLYLGDTTFLAGAGYDSSDYSMSVVDITKPAILKISAFDFAGNRTTVTSIYSPQIAAIQPALQNFGSTLATDSPIVLYDTLVNTGTLPIKLSNVSLLHGNVGFTIESRDSNNIAAGERWPIKIYFHPVKTILAVDSIVYFDECFRYSAALVGSGGGTDFFVSNTNWGGCILPPYNSWNWVQKGALIHNVSNQPIDVDTLNITDRTHFVIVPGQTFPVHLSAFGTAGDTASVFFYYEPSSLTSDTALTSWVSPQVKNSDSSLVIRYSKLIGYGIAPNLAFANDTSVNLDCDAQTDTVLHFAFVMSNSGTAPAVINKVTLSNTIGFVNLMGHDQHGFSWDPAKTTASIPIGASDTFTFDFDSNPDSNISTMTRITAFGPSGDTLAGKTLTAAVNINYWRSTISADTIQFQPVEYNTEQIASSFIITNTGTRDELINSPELTGQYNASFNFITIPPVYTPVPDTLPPGQNFTVIVWFDPSISPDSLQEAAFQIATDACLNSKQVPLIARIKNTSSVAENITAQSSASILQLDDARSIKVIIPLDWTQPTRLDIYNILGETVYTSSLDGTAILDLGTLPRGVYFYRLRESERSQTGKILLNK